MRLSEIMSTDVVTTSPDQGTAEARNEMLRRRIHHLVVVEGGRPVGVVSDRDLVRAKGQVRDVMTSGLVSAAPTTTVKQAANQMRGRTIGCLPVLDDGKLVGIVTITDLLDLIGRGAERPVAETTRATLKGRGPRKPALKLGRAAVR